ncbi:MAG TPA: hypothetical protein VJB66_03870 [Candidatus Nanoarchaeia archaeon]|nr:hypothetical protein [Candidatus Nanoarchaeia archaeon]
MRAMRTNSLLTLLAAAVVSVPIVSYLPACGSRVSQRTADISDQPVLYEVDRIVRYLLEHPDQTRIVLGEDVSYDDVDGELEIIYAMRRVSGIHRAPRRDWAAGALADTYGKHTITIGDPDRNSYTRFLHERIRRADLVIAEGVTLRGYTSRDGNTFILEITAPDELIREGCRAAVENQGLEGRIIFLVGDPLKPEIYLK